MFSPAFSRSLEARRSACWLAAPSHAATPASTLATTTRPAPTPSRTPSHRHRATGRTSRLSRWPDASSFRIEETWPATAIATRPAAITNTKPRYDAAPAAVPPSRSIACSMPAAPRSASPAACATSPNTRPVTASATLHADDEPGHVRRTVRPACPPRRNVRGLERSRPASTLAPRSRAAATREGDRPPTPPTRTTIEDERERLRPGQRAELFDPSQWARPAQPGRGRVGVGRHPDQIGGREHARADEVRRRAGSPPAGRRTYRSP